MLRRQQTHSVPHGGIGHHRFRGPDDLATLEHHAHCPPTFDQNLIHMGLQAHFAAILLHTPAANRFHNISSWGVFLLSSTSNISIAT